MLGGIEDSFCEPTEGRTEPEQPHRRMAAIRERAREVAESRLLRRVVDRPERRVSQAVPSHQVPELDHRHCEEVLVVRHVQVRAVVQRGRRPRLADAGALARATCTWTLWSGYLNEPSGQRLQAFLEHAEIPGSTPPSVVMAGVPFAS